MLSKEQVESIKKQILSQIDSWKTGEEQKKEAKRQIEEMEQEELEKFLNKNKLLQEEKGEECVFCLIVEEKIPAHKVDEDANALAVLEINPLSKGHTIIIPKKHEKTGKFSNEVIEFAKKVATRLGESLKPKEIKIGNSEMFGHAILNVLPIYGDEKLEKRKADEKELKEIMEKINKKPEKVEIKIEQAQEKKEVKQESKKLEQPKKLEKAPRRFP